MQNVLRTLICNQQISLTLADTTEIVRHAQKIHGLRGGGVKTLGKVLSVATFMSAALKEESGEISLSVQGEGMGGPISVSGNRALQIRGYMENASADGAEEEILGRTGALTVIRDDGYSRPFVGSCAFPQTVDVEGIVEEYYRISEQLPTFVACAVELDAQGVVSFAGVAVLQPLPFAEDEVVNALPKGEALREIVQKIPSMGLEAVAIGAFSAKKEEIGARKATYTCNCSRPYLMQVLTSLGEEQMRTIIREDGAVRVHCHYCNTDYVFDDQDADYIFGKK